MEFWVIDEAEDYIVLHCCPYGIYVEARQPPWDLEEMEEEIA